VAELIEIRSMQRRKFWRLLSIGYNKPTWVGLTQHYDGNTRLVDVSYDKHVGLFFACWDFRNPSFNKNEDDGFMYSLKVHLDQ